MTGTIARRTNNMGDSYTRHAFCIKKIASAISGTLNFLQANPSWDIEEKIKQFITEQFIPQLTSVMFVDEFKLCLDIPDFLPDIQNNCCLHFMMKPPDKTIRVSYEKFLEFDPYGRIVLEKRDNEHKFLSPHVQRILHRGPVDYYLLTHRQPIGYIRIEHQIHMQVHDYDTLESAATLLSNQLLKPLFEIQHHKNI
jgi:hypothetical protein